MFYLTLCRDIEKGRHNDPGEEKVLPLTQESAADLNSMASYSLGYTCEDGRGKTYRSCQKHESLSLHGLLSTGRHLLGFFFYNKPKVKFMHSSNHIEHYRK